MTRLTTAYLLLGSNEGDRREWLKKAIAGIEAACGHIVNTSSVYETAAWGITDQADFLNMVVSITTTLTPQALLRSVLSIEQSLGRSRQVKWGPRIIDIDILFYDNMVMNTSGLIIPHPYLHERRFTLMPLAEIAPAYIHPRLKKPVSQLLSECPDTLEARISGRL